MKPLVVIILLVGSTLSEMVPTVIKSKATSSAAKQQFAEARDATFGKDFHATEWETVPYPGIFLTWDLCFLGRLPDVAKPVRGNNRLGV